VLGFKFWFSRFWVMAYYSFEELEVWQRACDAAVAVCEAVRVFKDFAFRDQMTRAAISIPSNIAEGAERSSKPDFIRFLHYSKGSSAELRTQIMLAVRLGYLTRESGETFLIELKRISAMLHRLVQSLEKD
jgi:four helix bundle protein